MAINTLFYSIRQGLKNIWRNKMFSIASMATMAACIFMFGIFYILVTNINAMIKDAEEGVAVTVFFQEDITLEEIESVGEGIYNRPEVAKMNYVSAEEAWEYFKTVYFEGDEDKAAGFEEDNPLANSANYEIYLKDVAMQDDLVAYLQTIPEIRSIKESEAVANILTDFNRLISAVSIAIISILLCVAVFLISNTISIGVSVRKDEISIMKLIGATDFLVRAPFIVEGIVIGLIGAIIPLIFLYTGYDRITLYITEKFNFIGSMLKFVHELIVFQTLVPVSLGLGVGIGFIGSIFTLRKHLKV